MGKLADLFFDNTASLVMAEYTCAHLRVTSLIGAPSLVNVDPNYLDWLMCYGDFPLTELIAHDDDLMPMTNVALVGADFHAVSSNCFRQSFSELLQFVVPESRQTDGFIKLQATELPSDDGHRLLRGCDFLSICKSVVRRLRLAVKLSAISFPGIY